VLEGTVRRKLTIGKLLNHTRQPWQGGDPTAISKRTCQSVQDRSSYLLSRPAAV
jgi:hypothetical protein